MKPKTIQQFADAIAREITWRKRELSNFNVFVKKTVEPRYLKDALYRSGIPLLYAHWEGFVKQSCTLYLYYVCMQRIKNKNLSINLQALLFYENLKRQENTKRPSLYQDAIEFLRLKGDHDSKIPYKNIVDTKSNLNSDVFREIAWLMQMDYSIFETSEQFIDKILLAKRNNIAHGEECPVDKATYMQAHSKVIELMENVKTQLENNVQNKVYAVLF